MKNILIGLFSAALLLGGAAAQDATAPAGTPQTSNPTQPQTSSPADTRTPQQLPETQPPANQPSPQSAPQQPATQTQTPQASSNSGQPGAIKRVAPGSVIPVQLTKSIDAKKAKTGDEVVAKVTMDLKSNSGEVVFAKDTKVVGHVTEAQARNKDQKESQVGIMFDKAVTKTGDMQLPMSIQAVIAPQNPNSTDQGGTETATATTASGARPSSMNGSNQAQPPTTAPTNNASTGTDASASPRPQITGNTQGVVGFSNLNLAAAPDATQGSVLTSDKSNVKLDSGTFMLLRVNQ
jgi:hypothetical protein